MAHNNPSVAASEKPPEFEGVGITENVGGQLDLNLQFVDENGNPTPLRSMINGSKPVILGFVYYECPNLCNFFMNGLTDSLKELKWEPGKDFEVVLVSIDTKETPDLAKQKKAAYMKAYGRVGTDNGWHFLTGDEKNVKALAAQAGFGYRWDPKTEQWAHNSAAILTTPYGQISRYLYGIMFDSNTLKLSLVEAGKNKIGGLVDQILLFCYKFDPVRNRYSLYAMNLMRITAGLTILIMGIFLLPYWRRNSLGKKTV